MVYGISRGKIREREKMMWKVFNLTTKEVVCEDIGCPGNAAELAMVLEEIKSEPHVVLHPVEDPNE